MKPIAVWMRSLILITLHCSLIANISLADEKSWTGKPLEWEGDLASRMIDGIDQFLLRKTEEAKLERPDFWGSDATSIEAFNESLRENRDQLKKILGLRDERIQLTASEWKDNFERSNKIATGKGYTVFAVSWPVLSDPDPNRNSTVSVTAAGLLLVPKSRPIANIIAIPDADQTPEELVGLVEGIDRDSQFARRFAEAGCNVLVPVLINRELKARNGRAVMTNREFVHRSAYELGRHIIGYELQKILAGVDYFEAVSKEHQLELKTGVIGYGEGGMLALFAGALDTRIDSTTVLGFFGPREQMWSEPVDRNVFGFLKGFGAAEVAIMVLPRQLIINDSTPPNVQLTSQGGGAPGSIPPLDKASTNAEIDRVRQLVEKIPGASQNLLHITQATEDSSLISDNALVEFLVHLDPSYRERKGGKSNAETLLPPEHPTVPNGASPKAIRELPDTNARQQQQLEEIDRHNQLLLRESPFVRQEFMKELETSSLEAFQKSVEGYREIFREEVIGEFDDTRLPLNPRTRLTYGSELWTGYEVVLDVFPDVFAYGVLLVPNDLKDYEKRPVVVCQHGLEGRPTDTFLENHRAYANYAAELADRGYVVFAPQNPYIFKDRFRTLQRKANPLGKTLFSVIVPQHEAITEWLASLPFVDGKRIGFYGLSYGGKSAMRIPALVDRYCLSICSADFNEWVLKNASTRHKESYVWTGEYEIFEFDLGSTFNYAEMATLIAPRPFMVERGHFDGVAADEWVGYEFAKIRHLYQAKLGIGDRCEIEWFVGPHKINGKGTFDFLQKHLDWPEQ